MAKVNIPAGERLGRLGFMAGKLAVPDDFDRMGSEEIEALFNAESLEWPRNRPSSSNHSDQ